MRFLPFAGFILAMAFFGGCDRPSRTELKIGLNTELSDSFSAIGSSSENAAKLFVEERNAQGGVRMSGRAYPITLVVKDNRSRPAEAVAVARQLIVEDDVVAMVGPNVSSCAVPASDVAQALHCPMITPWSTDLRVTWDDKTETAKEWIYRICFTDNFQAQLLAEFATDKLQARRAAILYDASSDAPGGQANLFLQEFENKGGQVFAMETYEPGASLSRQLEKIRAAKPDFIFLPAYYTDVASISREARKQGITAPFIGTDNWATPGAIQEAGKELEGSYFCSHYSSEKGGDKMREFTAAYKKRFGVSPDDGAALTYDALGVLCDALATADSLDRSAVRKALSQTANYDGVTGKFSFDPAKGDPVKSAVILQVKDGGFRWVADIQP